jgi:hypothetical protein
MNSKSIKNNVWSFLTAYSNNYAAWGCVIQQQASDLKVSSFGFNHPIPSCNMVLYPLHKIISTNLISLFSLTRNLRKPNLDEYLHNHNGDGFALKVR